MAGCSIPGDDCTSLDVLHILRRLQSVGFCSDLDPSLDCCRFEQILSFFLKDLHCNRGIRPIPAMLGDGRPVDLYRLYCLVFERGGYDSVTASKSWAVVAEGIGFDLALECPLKLIYAKYLDAFERCLQRVPGKKAHYGGSEENVGVLVSDSELDVRGLFQEILKQKMENGWVFALSSCSKRDHFLTAARENERMPESDKPIGSAALGPKSGSRSFSSLKRKRDPLVGMLSWVKTVARNPTDLSTGKIVPPNGLKVVVNGEQFSLSLQARKALFLKEIRRGDIDVSPLQKGQKMKPSIYEDYNGAATPSLQTSRCSQCLHSSDKPSYSVSCTEASMICVGENNGRCIANGNEINHFRRKLRNSYVLPDHLADCLPERIPVGPFFQAKVPAWPGKHPGILYDSNDEKWLGRRIWPPEDHGKKQPTEQHQIGKGRADGCKCRHPGSVECVRFHVAEKRLQLKRELGAIFYAWRFHCMGEEVALSWKEEERRFKETVCLNQPPQSKNLWQQLYLCFPSRGNRSLVSYYFNVFLLARRSYQNRVTPNNIDSDDEETEFGFLSRPFGYEAIRFHDLRSITCSQNSQCVDVDD